MGAESGRDFVTDVGFIAADRLDVLLAKDDAVRINRQVERLLLVAGTRFG
jgi:hypothetical protein